MPVDNKVKYRIVDLHCKGLSTGAIRRVLSHENELLSWSTINYYVQKCKTGSVGEILDNVSLDDNIAPEFNFHTLNSADVLSVHQNLKSDPIQTSRDVQNFLSDRGINASKSTVKRVISVAGVTYSTIRYCHMVRHANQQKRLDFCIDLLNTNDNFDNVIFTDESSFQLKQNKRHSYRLKTAAPVRVPRPKHALKTHVWAGISRKGPTEVLQFEGIMERTFFVSEILDKTLKPYIGEKFPPGTIHRFQQDNDPKHTSILAKQYLRDENINWTPWPAGKIY